MSTNAKAKLHHAAGECRIGYARAVARPFVTRDGVVALGIAAAWRCAVKRHNLNPAWLHRQVQDLLPAWAADRALAQGSHQKTSRWRLVVCRKAESKCKGLIGRESLGTRIWSPGWYRTR